MDTDSCFCFVSTFKSLTSDNVLSLNDTTLLLIKSHENLSSLSKSKLQQVRSHSAVYQRWQRQGGLLHRKFLQTECTHFLNPICLVNGPLWLPDCTGWLWRNLIAWNYTEQKLLIGEWIWDARCYHLTGPLWNLASLISNQQSVAHNCNQSPCSPSSLF